MVKVMSLFLVLCFLLALTSAGCSNRPTGLRVDTKDATEITATSARLNGTLIFVELGIDNVVRFQWDFAEDDPRYSPGNPYRFTDPQRITSPGDFSFVIYGLIPGASYSFRAVYGDFWEKSYLGKVKQFTTNSEFVETLDASYPVVSTMARLNGNLLDMGGASSVEVYFMWGDKPSVYTHESPRQTMTAPGEFFITVMGPFNIGSTYYFVAKAGAIGQGFEKSFVVQ